MAQTHAKGYQKAAMNLHVRLGITCLLYLKLFWVITLSDRHSGCVIEALNLARMLGVLWAYEHFRTQGPNCLSRICAYRS